MFASVISHLFMHFMNVKTPNNGERAKAYSTLVNGMHGLLKGKVYCVCVCVIYFDIHPKLR